MHRRTSATRRAASATGEARCRSISRSTSCPRWRGDERLARTPIVHVTPGLDGVSRAVNEAERGLLPAEATIVCGQPLAVDPSRAPEGKGILWIQLQELPSRAEGRCRRRARDGERLGRAAPRGVRRSDRGAARRPHREPRARRRSGASCSAPQRSPRRTRTGSAATSTAARARSTRTCSGGRLPRPRATRRRSSASSTSARARIPGQDSARAPVTSPRSD